MLIAIEGIDGAGKSTLATGLAQSLQAQSLPVLLTKEPGATPVGALIRTMVHDATLKKDPKTEFLLFAADRAQHMSDQVIPALLNNKIVISDRLADSSLVYQGYARNVDHTIINLINAWVMNNQEPDLIIYLRISVQKAYERLMARALPPTSFEQNPFRFFQSLVDGFDAVMNPKKNVLILDADLPAKQLVSHATDRVLSWI